MTNERVRVVAWAVTTDPAAPVAAVLAAIVVAPLTEKATIPWTLAVAVSLALIVTSAVVPVVSVALTGTASPVRVVVPGEVAVDVPLVCDEAPTGVTHTHDVPL